MKDALERAGISFITDSEGGGCGNGEGVRFRLSTLVEYRPTPKEVARDKAWVDASKRAWNKRKPPVTAKERIKGGG